MDLRHLLILQNKVDLVRLDVARRQHRDILEYKANTIAREAPVIPISAQHKRGPGFVLEHIVRAIPVPARDYSVDPRMIAVLSFNVNKPGPCITTDSLMGICQRKWRHAVNMGRKSNDPKQKVVCS
jgi:translation initiation factor 2 subunit 3